MKPILNFSHALSFAHQHLVIVTNSNNHPQQIKFILVLNLYRYLVLRADLHEIRFNKGGAIPNMKGRMTDANIIPLTLCAIGTKSCPSEEKPFQNRNRRINCTYPSTFDVVFTTMTRKAIIVQKDSKSTRCRSKEMDTNDFWAPMKIWHESISVG